MMPAPAPQPQDRGRQNPREDNRAYHREAVVFQQALGFLRIIQDERAHFRQQMIDMIQRNNRNDQIIQLIVVFLLIHWLWTSLVIPQVVKPLNSIEQNMAGTFEAMSAIRRAAYPTPK